MTIEATGVALTMRTSGSRMIDTSAERYDRNDKADADTIDRI